MVSLFPVCAYILLYDNNVETNDVYRRQRNTLPCAVKLWGVGQNGFDKHIFYDLFFFLHGIVLQCNYCILFKIILRIFRVISRPNQNVLNVRYVQHVRNSIYYIGYTIYCILSYTVL